MSNSPTLSMAATRQGVILGTAAYMSPEQAKGKAVDRRADVWAFGAVLYEMLTGKQAFQGDDVTEVLAAVVREDPDWKRLPATVPSAIRILLHRCLERNIKRRLLHIGEARIVLEDILSGTAAIDPAGAASTSRQWMVWAAALVLAMGGLAALAFVHFSEAPEETNAVRFFVSPEEGWTLSLRASAEGAAQTPIAVSPDGQRVALVAESRGKTQIWLRSIDTLAAEPLAGTEGAFRPFWSPDSRFLGFFVDGTLKKIDVSGGPPITLCDAPNQRGGTWGADGVIVFARNPGPLQKVSAAGGVPTAATILDQGESNHGSPSFLPDGRHFLYRAADTNPGESIYVGAVDSAERKLLLTADAANAEYSQGHLLFFRETTLMAQPFDTGRLELAGEAFPIAEQVVATAGNVTYGFFSASNNGVLAYLAETGTTGSQLAWFDRAGKQIGVLGDTDEIADLELSPDGRRVSVSILDRARRTRDIWIYEVARGLKTRFTFDPAEERVSVWSPDSTRLVFNSGRKGHFDLYEKAASGAGTEEVLLADNTDKYPAWSPDGRFMIYGTIGNGADQFVLPLSRDRKPTPFLQTEFNENVGQFSPDGRWVVYRSDESGVAEIYVTSFPGPGGKWQVSNGGGNYPRWRSDGTEIFYLAPDNVLMVVAVDGRSPSFEVGPVKQLFQTRARSLRYPYAVSSNGQRFLINMYSEQTVSAPITVVLNWTAGLQQ